ncbi:bifunctional diguanylate cyclase/phosphodiesterase [Synechococcus sp. ATX 2A4]|uniref:putative bifunctional diguanylate cyclase/phosphodiesterase n=1 Tax=Synechococcus sp. ATX 2A4 TaxID=2823727 RepID=UPI0020CC1FA0|nr:bifunctional diguanylate cyclase/phosphodiesterase [Synechococcus sp. ATX 2A4]MCP9883842.1 bifunctional diguanylate cyclase/phosphodiesterase [Synechococcus sp. ATX 2A4]
MRIENEHAASGIPWSLRAHAAILAAFSIEDPSTTNEVVDQLALALKADVAALITNQSFRCSVGLSAEDQALLLRVAADRPTEIRLATGLRQVHWCQLPGLDVLLVARFQTPFDLQERWLLEALAQSLQLCAQVGKSMLAERSATRAALDQSSYDMLTGLPNRTHVLSQLALSLEMNLRSSGSKGAVAVLFIDIDRFKLINDAHGHTTGDRFLITVAKCLRQCVRSGDLVGRLSGDEFIIVSSNCSQESVQALGARIIDLIGRPMTIGNKLLSHSASIGVAIANGKDSAEVLIENADMAMYKAKANGRGCLAYFDQQMRNTALKAATMEQDLRRALAAGEIVCYFQPIFHVHDQRILGFEALARWKHPMHGLITPGEFIPVAEESGLIVQIDTIVLQLACKHMARCYAVCPDQSLGLSVNLSVRSLLDPGTPQQIAMALFESGFPPDRLYIEITETMLIEDVEATLRAFRQIKALGANLAIDDFGSGYTSMRYLKQLPVEILKIDRSFIEGLGRSQEDEVIVKAVLSMAKALGLHAIAEGVERQEQLDVLKKLGCDYIQGYLVGRPKNASSTLALIQSRSTSLVDCV